MCELLSDAVDAIFHGTFHPAMRSGESSVWSDHFNPPYLALIDLALLSSSTTSTSCDGEEMSTIIETWRVKNLSSLLPLQLKGRTTFTTFTTFRHILHEYDLMVMALYGYVITLLASSLLSLILVVRVSVGGICRSCSTTPGRHGN